MMRLRRVGLLLLALATTSGRGDAARGGFIAHEWGTFTSVVDEHGVPLVWRPFDEPSDLPRFVYTACADGCAVARVPETNGLKATLRALVRLETPVLYFYTPAPMTIAARVSFPGGRLTEWYPQARSTSGGLAWDHVTLQPQATPALLDEAGPRVYYAARAVDAVPLTVDGADGPQSERFLFYRGVGHLMSPALVTLTSGGDVAVLDGRSRGISDVVLFERRRGRVGYAVRTKTGPTLIVRRQELAGTVAALRADLVRMLIRHGLYEREAAAMVATWGDSWFEEGTRVFYIVPTAITEAVLPLQLEPRPSSLVRVLVARVEILTPERLAAVESEVRGLTPERMSDVAAVRRELGRFGEPALRRLLEIRTDAPLRARLRVLLGRDS